MRHMGEMGAVGGEIKYLPHPRITRIKGEIWEKWGATYGRNGWVGEKKQIPGFSSRKVWKKRCGKVVPKKAPSM